MRLPSIATATALGLLVLAGMTQAGEAFVFTITADSHLDERTDLECYLRTLKRGAADRPLFHVDLGDTFMSEKHTNRADAARQYADQQRYLAQPGAPVHLVIGNHDGENGRFNDGTPDCLAQWSRRMRMQHFPEPLAPDGRNYYSWETNGVLCVALDPFWFTPRARRTNDNWITTLGRDQYEWLRRTLESSRAKFKFVFIHNLVGGTDRQGRGGIEAAPFYEWGGRNADGSDGFAAHRPGWAMPVHRLLLTNHVAAVFHGHDHVYARQELDGILYQEVPQPGDPKGSVRNAADYGYTHGVILPGPGYLRVTVSNEMARVEYIRTGVRSQNEPSEACSIMAR